MNGITQITESEYYLQLSNGNKLCFAQYGDVKGEPLFFFHGWPSSRLEAHFFDTTAKRIGIRIIAPDRPGYGFSDFDKKRTLHDWPDTMIELSQALKIKKFSVLGNSGGGPYAAVCAFKLTDRIKRVGICVGLAPTNIDGVLEGMAFMNKLTWRSYHYFPLLTTISPLIHYLKQLLLPNDTTEAYPSKVDRFLFNQKLKKSYIQNRKEAYRQGIKGAADDLKLYTSDWGFSLMDITVPVYLWYGGADKNVSVEMGRYYHRMIPKSTLKEYPEEGHLLLKTHTEEILRTLCI
jgi:pimeloyl-ACP methyl ester carboxylesterase